MAVVQQNTLNGIPQPETAPRNSGGRPRKPADKKPKEHKLIGFYQEDVRALQSLLDSGYGKNASAIVRRAMREAAAFEQVRLARQQEGRLEI